MTIKLGLVGTGTVGGGCIDILQKHKEDFKRHYGIDVELARVCCACWEKVAFRGGSGVRLVMREWLSLHGTDGTVNALFEDHARTFYRQLLEIEEAQAGSAA